MSAPVSEAMKPNALTRELWHIAGTGDVERLEQLLDDGADVSAGDASGVTALMRAAYHGQQPMVRVLIEHGADPNAKDRGGLTALSMARHGGHQEIVEELLSCGAESKRAVESKPRLVASVNEESIEDAGDDSDEATPSPTSNVRTLQEPPDIWELVHTTVPDSDLPPQVVGPSSFARPLMVGAALIICAAVVFGWFYLRDSGNSVSPSESQAETVTTKPAAPARQPQAAAGNKQAEPRRIIPAANDQSKLPVVKITGERQASAPVAAPVALSAKRPATKTQTKSAKTSPTMFRAESRNPRPPARSDSGAETSASLKKEPVKGQTQPSDPPKPSTPKPKVIQWP